MPAIAPAFAVVSAFVATPVGGLLAGVALNVLGGLVSQALASQPKQNDPGVELVMRVGGDHALSFIVGTSATAGHRTYAGAWGESEGTPNAYFVDVLELGNVAFDSLAGTVVNGERSEVFWNQPHAEFGYPVAFGRRDGKDHLFVKFKDGRQTEADPYLRSRFGAHPQYPYEADMVGRGTPYAIVTVLYHRELWQGSAPTMLFEVRGIRCYDVRKDSTAGGVGAHRRANPATWEWSDNPWVIAYNTAFMGVYHETEWLWGLQNLPAIRLPLSAWVAAMNEADRAITLPGGAGATERQFRIGGEVFCDTQPADYLEQIGASCSGRTIEVGGYYKPQCGAPGSSVFTIDARHLVISEGRNLTPFPGLEATHNTIQVEYTEPAEAYGAKSAPERTKAEFVVADGNRKLVAGVRLPMVQRNTQAQRLGATMLADARQFRQFAGAFHPLLWVVEPGDVISVNLPEEGFVDKKFVVLQMAGRRTFVQSMTFKETDPADFDVPRSIILPYTVGPVQTSYPPAQAVSAWSASGYEHIDSQSRARRPGIKCFYGGGLPGIQYIKIMVRRPGETEPFASALVDYDASRVDASTILIGDYLLANEPYEVASILVPYEPRAMTMSDWVSVRTPNILLSGLDINLDAIAEQVTDKVVYLDEWARFNTRETVEEKRKAILLNVAGAVGDFTNRQMIQREASSEAAGNRSSFREDILTATGPNSALALLITELRAEVLDPVTGLPATTSLVNLLSAEVHNSETGLEAIGNSILQLGSTVGKFSADGLLRVQTVANTTGAVATAALGVAASDGANMGNAALYLRAMSDGSSEAFVVANRFAVKSSPTGTSYGVFAVDNGVVWIDEGRVRNLTSVNINVVEVLASNVFTTNFRASWAQLENAVVNNFRANAANIGDLTIGRDKLADGAFADYIGPGATSGSGNSVTYFSSDFVAGAKPVFMCVSAQVNRAGSPDGSVSVFLDGVSAGTSIPIGGSASTQYLSIALMRLLNNGQTYRLRLVVSNSGTQGSISVTEVAFGGMIPRK